MVDVDLTHVLCLATQLTMMNLYVCTTYYSYTVVINDLYFRFCSKDIVAIKNNGGSIPQVVVKHFACISITKILCNIENPVITSWIKT